MQALLPGEPFALTTILDGQLIDDVRVSHTDKALNGHVPKPEGQHRVGMPIRDEQDGEIQLRAFVHDTKAGSKI